MTINRGQSEADDAAISRPRSAWRSVLFFVIGLLLIGAAVWAVTHDWEKVKQSWQAARSAPAWMLVAAILLPIGNIVFVSLSFSVLTARYGRVGIMEMLSLICSAWLLNMLPMRPGLFGRVGYHKAVNGIRVQDSVKVLVQALVCNGAAMALALGASLLAARLGLGAWSLAGVFAVPGLVLAGAAWGMRATGVGAAWPGLASQPWRWPLAAALRYADISLWIIRYALVFVIFGSPLSTVGSTVTALASEIAMLSPILGLREWAVGLTSAAFNDPNAQTVIRDATTGLIGDAFNRAIELVVALPTGLAALAWLYRRFRVCEPRTK